MAQTRRGGLAALSDREVEEVGRLYRAAATHLALVRAFGASTRRRERLNHVVAEAHALIYGRRRRGRNAASFLLAFLAFPETVRRTLRYHVVAAVVLLLGGLYGYAGAARDPEWGLEFVAPGDVRTPYASREELRQTLVEGRPREAVPGGAAAEHREAGGGEKSVFAAQLWAHNTRVALLAFFSGVLLALPTVLVLLLNGALLGVYSHTFHANGLAYEWWAWILPHGVTELLAIVLLAGGGLLLGHTVIAPGERRRLDALRAIRSDVVRLALFAFPMLLLAALLESFLRQSGLSDPARYGAALLTAVLWAVYLGLARVPAAAARELLGRRTVAERAVPLPVDDDLLGLVRRGR